jgi:hypothetical protein
VRAATLATALCLLLPLAACGDDDDAGEVVERSGYELTVPEGWNDESGAGEEIEVAGFSPDLLLVGEREDGFTTNVNVIRDVSPNVGLDVQMRAERDLLLQGGAPGIDEDLDAARDLSPVERTTLDGQAARAHEFELPQGERTVRVRQVFTRESGSSYVVSYTALPDRFDDELDAFAAILGSWRWR